MDRRNFLKMMSILSGSAVYSCSLQKNPKKLIPYLVPPEEGVIPGEPTFLATSCTECPVGCGVQVKLRDGIPVKLEGLPAHPDNAGALCMRGQAALERLYSPDRLQAPMTRFDDGSFAAITWAEASQRLKAAVDAQAGRRQVFFSGKTTGTLNGVIDDFCRTRGVERAKEYERYDYAALRSGYKQLFGRAEVPYYDVARSDLLVTFGAGLLETFGNPVRFSKELAGLRERGVAWHHFEPQISITGAAADQRHVLRPAAMPAVLAWLLRSVPQRRVLPADWLTRVPELPAQEVAEVSGLSLATLQSLAAAVGGAHQPLVLAGDAATDGTLGVQTALLAGLAQFAWGAVGTLVDFARGQEAGNLGTAAEAASLAAELSQGDVGVLFVSRIHDVAAIPGMTEALSQVGLVVSLSDFMTPSAQLADLVLPVSHSLESWGDVAPRYGVSGVIRPALQPLHDTLSEGDILLDLAGRTESFQEVLASAWEGRPASWLEAGVTTTALPEGSVALLNPDPATDLAASDAASGEGLLLVVAPSLRFFDGRSTPLKLLHEIPEPLSSVTYGLYASIAELDAQRLGLEDGDEVTLDSPAGKLTLPVRIQVGLPSQTVLVDATAARGLAAPVLPVSGALQQVFSGVTLAQTGKRIELPILAGSNREGEERGLLPKTYHDDHHHHEGDESLFPDHPHDTYRWGMAIDLDKCTGCSACVAACYIENNVAIVGPKEHLRGREMSWLRLEPYIQRNGAVEVLPIMCQHCDHAPCETVCPVYATYHNPEGLNAQIYNRCVGTRYCANNCPYKVRRFNWFEYERQAPYDKMINPDVSDRPAGVMEKCSLCAQRIRRAKDVAKDAGRVVGDGEVSSACAQTCPAGAITFGNLEDNNSRVHELAHSARAYRVLEGLGTRPAIFYLKKSNANHEKEAAAEHGEPHEG